MSEVLRAHLEAHLDQVDDGVRAALATWSGARRRLHNELTRRLGVLSSDLAVAERRFFDGVGAAPLRSRDESWRAFDWLAAFDRERMRIENEVWTLVRAANNGEGELLKALGGQADALVTTHGRIGAATNAAVDQVLAGDDTVGQSEFGRGLGRLQARRLDEARRGSRYCDHHGRDPCGNRFDRIGIFFDRSTDRRKRFAENSNILCRRHRIGKNDQ
jgi:hypothetical protein